MNTLWYGAPFVPRFYEAWWPYVIFALFDDEIVWPAIGLRLPCVEILDLPSH